MHLVSPPCVKFASNSFQVPEFSKKKTQVFFKGKQLISMKGWLGYRQSPATRAKLSREKPTNVANFNHLETSVNFIFPRRIFHFAEFSSCKLNKAQSDSVRPGNFSFENILQT